MTNNNIILRGVDLFYLATPELFLFAAILLLIPLKLFVFKNKIFKYSNKFSYLVILITLVLVLLMPYQGEAFNSLFLTTDFHKYIKLLILICIFFVLLVSKNKSKIEGINFPNKTKQINSTSKTIKHNQHKNIFNPIIQLNKNHIKQIILTIFGPGFSIPDLRIRF